jgi:hypothetical protein
MDDPETSFAYKLAARLFDSAFESCQRLPPADQQMLLREIAKRVLQQIPKARSEEQTAVKVIGVEIKQSP